MALRSVPPVPSMSSAMNTTLSRTSPRSFMSVMFVSLALFATRE